MNEAAVKRPNLIQALLPLVTVIILGLFSVLRWKAGMNLP